jgi:preprotein translocase subunit SecE
MSKFKAYIEDSYNELVHKVTWPTWSELQSSALVVMISSVIIALLIFAMDFSFSNVMEVFYGLFK